MSEIYDEERDKVDEGEHGQGSHGILGVSNI
jgi:hypothetical protein